MVGASSSDLFLRGGVLLKLLSLSDADPVQSSLLFDNIPFQTGGYREELALFFFRDLKVIQCRNSVLLANRGREVKDKEQCESGLKLC